MTLWWYQIENSMTRTPSWHMVATTRPCRVVCAYTNSMYMYVQEQGFHVNGDMNAGVLTVIFVQSGSVNQ